MHCVHKRLAGVHTLADQLHSQLFEVAAKVGGVAILRHSLGHAFDQLLLAGVALHLRRLHALRFLGVSGNIRLDDRAACRPKFVRIRVKIPLGVAGQHFKGRQPLLFGQLLVRHLDDASLNDLGEPLWLLRIGRERHLYV